SCDAPRRVRGPAASSWIRRWRVQAGSAIGARRNLRPERKILLDFSPGPGYCPASIRRCRGPNETPSRTIMLMSHRRLLCGALLALCAVTPAVALDVQSGIGFVAITNQVEGTQL